jgi:glycosidase
VGIDRKTSAWTKVPTGNYYFNQFGPNKYDLNYRNTDVYKKLLVKFIINRIII